MDSRDVRNILTTYTEKIGEMLDALRDETVWSTEYDDQFSDITKSEVVQVYTDWVKQAINKVLEGMTNEK